MKFLVSTTLLRAFWGLCVILVSIPHWGSAQTNNKPSYQDGRYTHVKSVNQLKNSQSFSLILPAQLSIPNVVKDARLNLRLDLGNDDAYGDVSFRAKVKFRLQGVKGNATLPMCVQTCQLETNRANPEALYTQDFRLLSDGLQTFVDNQAILDSFRVTIDSVLVTVDPTMVGGNDQQATLKASIAKDLRVTLEYAIDYAIDVNAIALNALTATMINNSKVMAFAWQPSNIHIPNYQFQLLRLYNLSLPEGDTLLRGQIQRDEALLTEVDWNKALTIETQSSNNRLKLTIVEGTGYYAWRVRPIGTYKTGGIANAANFGNWSATAVASGTPLRRSALPLMGVFYFTDADDQKNTIYSRTFTEGNRVSEKISYASNLQQIKQTQTYLPSRKTRILSQTVYDNSNRPALNTLPVPVADTTGLRGYQNAFVRSQKTDSVYRAKDFDGKANYRAASPIKGTNTDFSYYSGKNNVPSAEGYPTTRSLFYNDGTNRVKEQSGVGRTHTIGDSTGMGHTIKTLFSTASDPELIRLFGDEAPASESVMKTSTIDQNNTATITYTSKEGQVIATALAFQDQSSNLLPLESNSPDNPRLRDVIQSKLESNKGFVGSKRISVVTPTPLDIAYKMDTCTSVTGDCITTKLACSFELWVVVRKVDGKAFSMQSGKSNYVTLGSNGKAWTFLPLSTAPGVDSSAVYSRDTTVSCTKNSSLVFSTLTVPAGSYIIEKKLLLRRQQTVVEAAQDQLDAQSRPFINLINGWTDKLKCTKDVEVFYDQLRTLSRSLDSVRTLCNTTPANCELHFKNLDQKYKLQGLSFSAPSFFNANHRIVVSPAIGKPQSISLSAACCQNINIPLTFTLPVFDFQDISLRDKNGDGLIKVNPFHFMDERKTEFFPDFEGYAFGYYWDCTLQGSALTSAVAGLSLPPTMYQGDTTIFYQNKGLSPVQKLSMLAESQNKAKYIYHFFLKPAMNGWETSGTLNLMVHHMLTDTYSADGRDELGNTVAERPAINLNECTGAITNPCTTGNCIQYNGSDLFKCWVNQLAYMKDLFRLCPNPVGASVGEEGEPPYKVSNTVDRENEGKPSKHDDHLTENVSGGGWLMNWFIKKKVKNIAKRIRDMQLNPLPAEGDGGDLSGERTIIASFKYHMVEQFLGCTGYRFAKILTNAPLPIQAEPLASDKISGITYLVPAPSALDTSWRTYTGKNRGYRPYGKWWVVVGSGSDLDTLFRSAKDPVYAFKYFQYVDWSMAEVEINTCYSDPNYYLAANGVTKVYLCPTSPEKLCNFCGIGRVKCNLTKEKWTAGQRYTFYEMVNRFRKPAPTNWRDEGLKPGDFASPGYVNQNEFTAWSEEIDQTYTASTYSATAQDFKLGAADRVKARVEIDISSLNAQLATTCERKRASLKQTLIDTLVARCYVIGGCKTADNDNVVPLEDLEFLVDAMVGECKQRGQTRTFHTTTDSCRYIYAPRSKLGHVDTTGARIEYSTVEYGVGSPSDTNCQKALLLYRTGFNTVPTPYHSSNPSTDTLRADPSDGNNSLVILECTGQTLTYQEYIRRKEVMEMVLRINLPSKCVNATAFVCAPDPGSSFSSPVVKENSLPNANNPLNPLYSGPAKKSDKVGLTVNVSKTNAVQVQKP